MGKLTCISWNIRGINSPIKRKKMLTYLKRQKVDIAFIQESHLTDSEHLKLCRDWVGNVFYSSFSSKARGVALLINKHLNFKLNSVEKDQNGRFLLVDCEINRNKMSLVNIYGPNYDDPLFFNNLIMKLATIGGQCVVGGDFNLVLNPLLDRSLPKTSSLSKAATALNQGMKDIGIIDVWRNRNPNQKDFSFFSPTHNTHSRIDMFLMSQGMIATVIECSYLPATFSDHNPIKLSWLVDTPQPTTRRWRFKNYMLKDPEFISYMTTKIEIFLDANSNSSSHANIWEALKAYMRGQILSYSAHKVKQIRERLTKLERDIRKQEQEYIATKKEEHLNTLKKTRLEYNNLCTSKEEAAMARTRYHYYEFGNKTSKLLAWQIKKETSDKFIHSILTEDGRLLDNSPSINAEFKQFYENLYKTEQDADNIGAKRFMDGITLPKLQDEDRDLLDADISEMEVFKAINSLQNNKTPGPDGFPVEYYKAFSKKLLTPLTNMITEALQNKKLPDSLEIATITLLLKSGKDKQKCDSYRPLSLLNADYKILSKLIALRLEDVIPKIIHADQTGFVKNRYGADNVRRLLHILNTAQKNQNPMLIMSMDANKAFDRIEPSFLFRTLEAMSFGEKFIQYVKTLFNAPKANILTNDILSNTFSLSRGCRQGCPSSPLLFALAIEPLAIAIRSNTFITGIKFGTNEHKLSLYADDLLLYITDPQSSLPPLLKCLKEYSAASGYTLNYTKSEILPLNIQDNNIRTLTDPLKWCSVGFKYLGIQIGKSNEHIFKQNYMKLLEQTKFILQRWIDLPLSLIGRINTIKMSILPKFIYLFQCLPINVPKSFFKELNKILTPFIWQRKNPRVKLVSLQAPYSRGGLNLPNFRNYYLASQYRSIWIWLHAENSEVRWVPIEQYEMKSVALKDIPFIGTKKCLTALTNNSIILNTFAVWQESHSLLNTNISFLRRAPLWGNPNLSRHIADSVLRAWREREIHTVADLYINDTFANFQQLNEKFKLPKESFFKFLQIRDWIKEKSKETFPYIPKETPLEFHLCNKLNESTKGIISSIYGIINGKLPIYDKTSTKGKWEKDLNCTYEEADWCLLLEQAQTVLTSTKHRQIQFNIFHRTYYTPYRLHKIDSNISSKCQRCKMIDSNISSKCQRCKMIDGDLIHMLWSCPVIEELWKRVIELTSRVIGSQIEQDPKLWILGDTSSIDVNYYKKYFILLASTAVKKCILINWKSENSPLVKHWINELVSYCTPEKIL